MAVKEIRNPANRLICRINEVTGNIEILEKGWVTSIQIKPGTKVEVSHRQKDAV